MNIKNEKKKRTSLDYIGINRNGQIYDLQTAKALNIEPSESEQIKADSSPEALEILRH